MSTSMEMTTATTTTLTATITMLALPQPGRYNQKSILHIVYITCNLHTINSLQLKKITCKKKKSLYIITMASFFHYSSFEAQINKGHWNVIDAFIKKSVMTYDSLRYIILL